MISSIFIALFLLDALLLWVLVSTTKEWWALKLAAILLVLGFNFMVVSGVNSAAGWPTQSELPDAALLDACKVVEPDPITHSSGAIYLWATPLKKSSGVFSYTPKGSEPRSYVKPYSRADHIACMQAQKQMRSGQTMVVGKPVKANSKAGHKPNGRNSRRIRFYKLPPRVEQRKQAGQ